MTRGFLRALPLLLLVASAGCAHIPYFKKWAKKPYLPYAKSKRYAFEYPRKWGEPVATGRGAELRHPDGLGSFSIAFVHKNDPDYQSPDKYRRDMAAWGSVEDAHMVSRIEFSRDRKSTRLNSSH